jgi:disulfide bond formation protein DsbB
MSVATFGGIIASVLLAYSLAVPKSRFSIATLKLTSKNILFIGFIIPFSAVVGSLVYSEVIGYPPCMLCWYARVAFYPQVIIFAIALFKKDKTILSYALGLTIFGLIVTGYHSLIQIIGESAAILPCATNGISCVTRDVFEYGFITIPFMGFVGFLVQFFAILVAKKAHKQSLS